jgi:hypothetical protein
MLSNHSNSTVAVVVAVLGMQTGSWIREQQYGMLTTTTTAAA